MTQRVTISESDPLTWVLRDEEESRDFFGNELWFLRETVEVPEQLVKDYKKAVDLYWKVQSQIDKIMKDKE
jgi:hypothetical protein